MILSKFNMFADCKSGRLVLSALSIPVSSAAVEVAFSMYKNLLKDDRKSLKPNTVEK